MTKRHLVIDIDADDRTCGKCHHSSYRDEGLCGLFDAYRRHERDEQEGPPKTLLTGVAYPDERYLRLDECLERESTRAGGET